MVWSKLLGGLASLAVLAAVLGGFAGLVPFVAGNGAALVALLVVLAVAGGVTALGLAGRATGPNPYW